MEKNMCIPCCILTFCTSANTHTSNDISSPLFGVEIHDGRKPCCCFDSCVNCCVSAPKDYLKLAREISSKTYLETSLRFKHAAAAQDDAEGLFKYGSALIWHFESIISNGDFSQLDNVKLQGRGYNLGSKRSYMQGVEYVKKAADQHHKFALDYINRIGKEQKETTSLRSSRTAATLSVSSGREPSWAGKVDDLNLKAHMDKMIAEAKKSAKERHESRVKAVANERLAKEREIERQEKERQRQIADREYEEKRRELEEKRREEERRKEEELLAARPDLALQKRLLEDHTEALRQQTAALNAVRRDLGIT